MKITRAGTAPSGVGLLSRAREPPHSELLERSGHTILRTVRIYAHDLVTDAHAGGEEGTREGTVLRPSSDSSLAPL